MFHLRIACFLFSFFIVSNYSEWQFSLSVTFLRCLFFRFAFERFCFEREDGKLCLWEKLWWWVSPHCNVRCWIYPAWWKNSSCGPLKSLSINVFWSFCWTLNLRVCLMTCHVCVERTIQKNSNRHGKSVKFHPHIT